MIKKSSDSEVLTSDAVEMRPRKNPRTNKKFTEADALKLIPMRQKKTTISYRIWLAGIFLLVGIIGISIYATRQTTAVQSMAIPQENSSPFENFKAALGLVEAASGESALSFEVGGKIKAVYVEEGQQIKAGSLIAELKSDDLVAKLKFSEANLNDAESKRGMLDGNLASELAKAKSEVERLKAELTLLEPRRELVEQMQAETNAVECEAKRLAEDAEKFSNKEVLGAAFNKQLFDQANGLAKSAAAKLEAVKAQLRAMTSGSRAEEKDRIKAMLASVQAEVLRQNATNAFQIQSADAQIEQARAQVTMAKAELEKTKIISAMDCTVIRKYMHPGEVLNPLQPQPVVTVADMEQLRVRADVDEADVQNIHVGQRVKIMIDTQNSEKYRMGKVEKISHATGQKRFSTGAATEKMDVKIIETVINFDSAQEAKTLKLGLRVTVYFEIP